MARRDMKSELMCRGVRYAAGNVPSARCAWACFAPKGCEDRGQKSKTSSSSRQVKERVSHNVAMTVQMRPGAATASLEAGFASQQKSSDGERSDE